MTGVRSDGQSVSLTTAITIIGNDRLRWETFDRTVGGEAMPDTDRFILVRRPDPRQVSSNQSAVSRVNEAPARPVRR